tara:strand:- start:96 stop:284 length:189 start_codon:yes stop_codon:yes gene_type:complete
MDLGIKKSELKTLKLENGKYSYSLKTEKGTIRCSNIDTVEAALRHAEKNCKTILKSILKKEL